jgi:hypothetical protein
MGELNATPPSPGPGSRRTLMTGITRGSRVVFPVTVGGPGRENHRTVYREGTVVRTWHEQGAERARIREDSDRYASGRAYLTRPVAVLVTVTSLAGQQRLAEETWNDRYNEWDQAGKPAHPWRPLVPGATACWQCGHQKNSPYHPGKPAHRHGRGGQPCHCKFPGLPNRPANHLKAERMAQSASRQAPAAVASSTPGSHQAGLIHCGPCGAEIEEQDTGLWETGGDTAGQRRHCTESRDHLHHPDAAGQARDNGSTHDIDAGYGDECIIDLASGRTIRTDSYADSPEGSTYVRVCEADGAEAGYWTCDEWREAPEEVMGAILGAAKGGTLP